jgi:ABC-2 type transport system ATP-binding protein
MLKKVGLETAGKSSCANIPRDAAARGLAQAILHDPKLVNPGRTDVRAGSRWGGGRVRDVILELKNAGKTILFSTHILPDAEMLCDRVGVIAGGRLRGVGAPGAIVGVKATGMEILFELAERRSVAGERFARRRKVRYRLSDERHGERIVPGAGRSCVWPERELRR